TVYRLRGQYSEAEAVAKRALMKDRDDVEGYKSLALTYLAQGRTRLAEIVAGNARKHAEKDPGVENILGLIALRRGEVAGAQGHFQRALRLDAAFEPAHYNLGALALSYRDYASAERYFTRAARLRPSSAEATFYLALALSGQQAQEPAKGLRAGE